MAMSENATQQAPAERRRPVTLTRRTTPAQQAMLQRALPDDKPKLDVAAFQSSI